VGRSVDKEMNSRRFHITLPSNSSMDSYPNNTVAQFTTKLPHVIALDDDWEVGLMEISVPSNVHNAIEGHCYYDLYLSSVFVRRINVTPGHYRRLRDLVEDLHRSQRAQVPLQSHEPLLVHFTSEGGNKRVGMMREVTVDHLVHVEFNTDLARLLGYESNVRYDVSNAKISRFPPNLTGNIQSVYVYCDLVEHVVVGDVMAPLLRIVDMKRPTDHGTMHRMLTRPLYVPLQNKHFDTIGINIMTDTGHPVPFVGGKSVVVLEFKRVGLLEKVI